MPQMPFDPCADWQDSISAYLDGELPLLEEQEVHAHLRTCQACAESLIDLVPVVQALRTAPVSEPARDLWPLVAAELKQDRRFWTRHASRLPLRRVGWAAAALLLLVGGGVAADGLAGDPPPTADIDTYWHEHAIYSEAQGVPGLYAPSLHAVESSYELDSP